jgi:hypothetical protein
MSKFLSFIFSFLIILSSCTKKKLVQKNVHAPKIEIDKKLSPLENILKQSVEYTWLKGRARIHISSEDGSYTVSSSIKMRKDSIVFANAVLLIEAGKFLLKNDSAIVVDGIHKEYSVIKKNEIKNKFGIDNLDAHSFQNLMVGLPPFMIDKSYTINSTDSQINLSHQSRVGLEKMTFNINNMRLSNYSYKQNESQYIHFDYNNYQIVNNYNLPYNIIVNLVGTKKITIEIEVSNWEFINQYEEFIFKIPNSYKRQSN